MGISKGYVLSPMVTLLYPRLPNSKTNILIDDTGHARLADFGSFTVAGDQLTDTPSSAPGRAVPWMSPELLDWEKVVRLTKGSDCYALGMVIYEVISGERPFAAYPTIAVAGKVLNGDRPNRPQGKKGELFTDDIWDTLELCWKYQPHDRISASAVLLRLEGHPPLPMPSSNRDGDAETGSHAWSDSGSDDESGSGSDDQSESGSEDEWHSAESDCKFSPFRLGLTFDSPCVV